MTSHDERIEDLLVEWEASRLAGRELTLKELCQQDPELQELVGPKLAVLKELSWIADPKEMIGDDATNLNDSKTLPHTNVSVQEFLLRLSESGVLDEVELEQVSQFVPSDPQQLAKALAERLVDENLVTTYQAKVILERGDSPLLLDRYVILDSIGAGGMGVVFKALQRSLDRVVALKVLPRNAMDSPEKVERFQREMRAAAKLSHPNVVRAYDAHESNGVYFLAMEFVPGQDLAQLVECHGTLSATEAQDVIGQSATGLAHAHAAGIIHRDVKPSNIVLADDGTAKVTDLGLARTREQTRQASVDDLTREGLAMGTFNYMSPEQAFDAKQADEQSDIYSLGCTLYFLLHGRPLFERSNSVQTVLAHREQPAPSLGEGRDDVTPELEQLFQSMLAKDPAQRPASMAAVCQALAEYTTPSIGQPVGAPYGGEDRVQQDRVQQDPIILKSSTGDTESASSHNISAETSSKPVVAESKPVPAWWKLPAIGLLAATAGLIFLLFGPHRNAPSDVAAGENEIRTMAATLLNTDEYSLAATTVDDEYWLDFPEDMPDESFEVHTAFIYSQNITADESDGLGFSRLTVFSNLVSVQFSPPEGTDEAVVESGALSRLTVVPELQFLAFNNCKFDSFAGIEMLVGVDSVVFVGCELQGDFETLAQLPSLSYLDLTQSNCSDWSWLQNLKQLEYLDLTNSSADTSCLQHLQDLPRLESLRLTGLDLASDELHLDELKQLKVLSVDATELGDAWLSQIVSLELETLDISHTKITPAGLKELSRCKGLTSLQIAGLKIKPAVSELSALSKLYEINVENTDFDDACLDAISSLPRLETLYTYGTNLSNAAIDRFQRKSPDCEVVRESSEYLGPENH